MKKLDEASKRQLDTLAVDLGALAQKVTAAIAEANTALQAYNAKLGEAREFRDEIVAAMEDYESGRSDRWSESDAGAAYAEWKAEWEGAELDGIDEIEPPEFEHVETLNSLSDELP